MKIDQEEYTRTNNRNYRDEVDLREVFRLIGNGFSSLALIIRKGVRIAYKRAALIIVVSLIGVGLSYGAYYVTKPYYTSSMTLVLADIRNEFVEDQLTKLVDMIEEDNYAAISNKLDIGEDAAKQIKSMTFSNLDENRIAEDSVLTGSPFRIELQLYDNELFSSMEPALSNYLENNRYFSKQKRIKQRQVESIIVKLKEEIKSIDSLKTTVSNPRGPVNGFIYGEALDPTTLYRESVGMFKEQADLEAQLDQLDNIQVVTGFSPRIKPTGPKLLKFMFFGGLLFFFIGFAIAVSKEK